MVAQAGVGPALTVAMPAFDEAGNLERVIRDLLRSIRAAGIRFEIVIVDDGSTDDTAEIADRLAAEVPEVRVVHHGRNRGVGAAWRSCLDASRGAWVFFQPADGQLDPSTALAFFEGRGGADVVLGIRDAWSRPAHRRLLTTGFRIAMRLTLGLALPDFGLCFLFRGNLARSFRTVSGDLGVAVVAEWLFLALRDGATLSERPVEVLRRASGSSKTGRLDQALATLVDLIRCAIAYRVLRRRVP